ncbi:UDP-N-acetylmuramate dehydrogenase [bacterium]|nr:UDP-N-acetylmuramate dehydrogenase [bacterium]
MLRNIGEEVLPEDGEIRLLRAVSAKNVTTVHVGGEIESLYEVHSLGALQRYIRELAQRELPLHVLGAGSNSLFPDTPFRFPVVKLAGEFKQVTSLGNARYRVGAAMGLMRFARETARNDLSGLEFAGGIPASIGGAVKMNAGAHGSEFASVLEEVELLSSAGECYRLRREELNCSYRDSGLPPGVVIVGCTVSLVPASARSVQQALATHLEYRKRTQPLTVPSFGSVFRNPESCPAGRLIEEAGLKGERIGGAELSCLHANWVVNPSRNATYNEVRSLLERVRSRVREVSQIELREEVVDWGDSKSCSSSVKTGS